MLGSDVARVESGEPVQMHRRSDPRLGQCSGMTPERAYY